MDDSKLNLLFVAHLNMIQYQDINVYSKTHLAPFDLVK